MYDIVTGSLIDWVRFRQAPLSIDFAPSGEFLATSHLNSKAVFLWSNKAFFQQVVVQRVPTQAVAIDLPTCLNASKQKFAHKDFYTKDEQAGASKEEDEQ